jgi:hypothetical protein
MEDIRLRFEMRFSPESGRDMRLAQWIAWQQSEGRNATELIKMILEEVVTGQSCITGRPITYQGDVEKVQMPVDEDNTVANALNNMGD